MDFSQDEQTFSFFVCLCMDSEIYIFAKCIISTFSDLITPKLQTSEPSRKYQLFYYLSDTLFETVSNRE